MLTAKWHLAEVAPSSSRQGCKVSRQVDHEDGQTPADAVSREVGQARSNAESRERKRHAKDIDLNQGFLPLRIPCFMRFGALRRRTPGCSDMGLTRLPQCVGILYDSVCRGITNRSQPIDDIMMLRLEWILLTVFASGKGEMDLTV